MIKRGRKAIYSFKNMTKIQWHVITTPGIFHHEGLGLISISGDGSNWITISDKNLGATEVWNIGDELTQNNCGGYFQWGNNYMFPFTGAVTISNTKVDTTGYGPGNYYNSSTFIRVLQNPLRWDIDNNMNLWGGETGTNIAMQGPCPNGYHISSQGEFQNLYEILINVFGLPHTPNTAQTYLKMPFGGYRTNGGTVVQQGEEGSWQFSTAVYEDYSYGCSIYGSIYGGVFTPGSGDRAHARSIRPFKNTPVQPDTSRTVLYQPN